MALSELFGLSVSPLELVVRGTAMYWFLFVLFRVVLRRDTGSLAIADVLLLVIIADAAQNAMSGSYQSDHRWLHPGRHDRRLEPARRLAQLSLRALP